MNSKKQIAGKIGADEKKKKKKKDEEEDAMLVITTAATTSGGKSKTSPNTELESCPVSQNEQDSARTNLAKDVSVSQNEEKSRSFHKELDQQLSSRTISPELLEARRIIEDKDRKIEELNRLLNEKRQQTSSSLSLPNNLTKLIRQFPGTDFILKHNGYEVTSVQPAKNGEMSAAPDLSQTGTINTNQIQKQSQDGSSNSRAARRNRKTTIEGINGL